MAKTNYLVRIRRTDYGVEFINTTDLAVVQTLVDNENIHHIRVFEYVKGECGGSTTKLLYTIQRHVFPEPIEEEE